MIYGHFRPRRQFMPQLTTDALGQRHSGSGDRRPASTNQHDTLRAPPDCPRTSRHQLTWQCPQAAIGPEMPRSGDKAFSATIVTHRASRAVNLQYGCASSSPCRKQTIVRRWNLPCSREQRLPRSC
jgi:hypothetical protein